MSTAFWIIAGSLIAGALLLVLAPFVQRKQTASGATQHDAVVALHRDQMRDLDADLQAGTLSHAQYDEARREIERLLLEDVQAGEEEVPQVARRRRLPAPLITGVLLPVVAVALYLQVGNPRALVPEAAVAERPPHALDKRQVEAMVGRLAMRMQQNPDDAEGWVMLARSYTSLQRYSEAAQAYANAVSRLPSNAQLLADYADLLAMAQGRSLQGEPEKIIARALAADPNNVKARALAGSVAFEKREYSIAVEHWGRLLQLISPESDIARSIRGSIAQAQALARPPESAAARP